MTLFIIHNANVLDVTHVSQVILMFDAILVSETTRFVISSRPTASRINSHHTFQKQCHIVN